VILEFSRARQWRTDLARHGQNAALRARGQVLLDTLPTIGENVEYPKNCEYILCRKDFVSGRKDARFCCDAHRTAAGKMRDKREPSDLAKLMERAIEFDSQFYGGPSSLESKRARNDALRDVYDAIGAELGIVHETHETPVDELGELQNEPENDAEQDPLTPENVREKLRAFMTETTMGQGKIGKLAGVSQSTISQFLAAKTDGSEDVRRSIMDVVTQDHGMDRR